MARKTEQATVQEPLAQQLRAAGWRVVMEPWATQPVLQREGHINVRADIWAALDDLTIVIECKHVMDDSRDLREAVRQVQGYMSAFSWREERDRRSSQLRRPDLCLVATEHTLGGDAVMKSLPPVFTGGYFTYERELWDYGASFLYGPRLRWRNDVTGRVWVSRP